MATTVLHGSNLDTLPTLPDNSVDSIVTDPPYELSFMSKTWDGSGIAYSVDLWRECLRVLKPGGHLVAFGGTRTYHRMVCAIEDAGFEVRDSLHWTYGSGFPKSLNVGKALDKAAGATREVVGERTTGIGTGKGPTAVMGDGNRDITAPATEAAKAWDGWGTALKPSHEPVVLARKPLCGTVAANVLEHGTGALNIDGSRIGFQSAADKSESTAKNQHADFGTPTGGNAVYGDYTMVPRTNYNPPGRWPSNSVFTHSPACEQVGAADDAFCVVSGLRDYTQDSNFGARAQVHQTPTRTQVPVYQCAEGCPVPVLDGQSGQSKSTANPRHNGEFKSVAKGRDLPHTTGGHSDSGGASRFFHQSEWTDLDFPPFLYVAKPSKKERNAGLDGFAEAKPAYQDYRSNIQAKGGDTPYAGAGRSGKDLRNFHPTVKPVALMRYLTKLVTPPGGVVLDPFLGSGTTAVAATLEGFDCIGCELTDEYLPIIEARVAHAEKTVSEAAAAPQQLTL